MSANWATLSSGQRFPHILVIKNDTLLDLLTLGQHIFARRKVRVNKGSGPVSYFDCIVTITIIFVFCI